MKTQITYAGLFFQGGGYCCKHLKMRVANSPNILHQKINYLFQGFEFICAYIDGLLIFTQEACKNYAHKL